jgi:hypothetical protein
MKRNNINCLLIGSNGFLGSSLAIELTNTHVNYSELSHQNLKIPNAFFEITSPLIQDSTYFTHAIYLSWSTNRSVDFQEKSFFAAKYAADWAVRNGVRIIFVSSMSASMPFPQSNYGRFKKLAEDYFLSLGFEVVRPGTVLSKNDFAGGALSHLGNLSKLGRIVLAKIQPLSVPCISIEAFVDRLSRKIVEPKRIQIDELVENSQDLQSMLNLNSGSIPIKHLEKLIPLIPINVRDKLQTLIDLN